jgi:hypothetical protein
MTEQELYKQGWERFPWWWILLENLLFFAIWIIGFVVMWPLKIAGIPVVSLGYALFILITVGWLLKIHNCSNCYYYGKWCHLGWGKYTALLCPQNAGNPETGAKLAAVYMILPLIPIVGVIGVMLLYGFSWVLLGWMIVFAILNGVQFAIRPHACIRCKRRYICPGSAAK